MDRKLNSIRAWKFSENKMYLLLPVQSDVSITLCLGLLELMGLPFPLIPYSAVLFSHLSEGNVVSEVR